MSTGRTMDQLQDVQINCGRLNTCIYLHSFPKPHYNKKGSFFVHKSTRTKNGRRGKVQHNFGSWKADR